MNFKFVLLPILLAVFILWLFYFFNTKDAFNINTDQTAVVKEIKDLNRLETAQFTIEKIIDAQANSNNVFQEFLYGDSILLIAHGEVIAGFDFSKLTDSDVKVEDSELLKVTLPAPEILFTRIDNEKTKVYDRRQGVLTKGNKDLESEARKSAEDSIRKAACEADILGQAATNGEKQLKTMFSRFGYKEIVIDIPTGTCQ